MATKPALRSLFKGKDTVAEEKKEARAVTSGKISVKDYAKGEAMEGEAKGAKSRGQAIKSGRMSPTQYAKSQKQK